MNRSVPNKARVWVIQAIDHAAGMFPFPIRGIDSDNGARLAAALAAIPGPMILVSHDDAFVARLATRAMALTDGRLAPAEVHDHPHTHSHPHVHPMHG